jgi:hypothetical protein
LKLFEMQVGRYDALRFTLVYARTWKIPRIFIHRFLGGKDFAERIEHQTTEEELDIGGGGDRHGE